MEEKPNLIVTPCSMVSRELCCRVQQAHEGSRVLTAMTSAPISSACSLINALCATDRQAVYHNQFVA